MKKQKIVYQNSKIIIKQRRNAMVKLWRMEYRIRGEVAEQKRIGYRI